MRRKIIFIVPVILILLGIFFVSHKNNNKKYIFDHTTNISLKDSKEALSILPGEASQYKLDTFLKSNDRSPDEDFEVNHKTLAFLKSLEQLFPETRDLSEHLTEIRSYLFGKYSNKDAKELFELYSNYIACEVDIINKIDISRLHGKNSMDIIETLGEIQDFRRARLGNETADALFGPGVKASEYSIRKNLILNNQDLYGGEKEEALDILNNDMWGDDSVNLNKNFSPFKRYKQKLKLYSKDLEEASSDDHKIMIDNFRKEFFPEEIIKRMEALENKRKEESERESRYKEKEHEILKSELEDDEKLEEIRALQDEIFGKDADNFRDKKALEVLSRKME